MILFRGFSTTISEPEGAVSLKEKEMSYEFIKRSEEHTSELQSLVNLVCRLLLEKKNIKNNPFRSPRGTNTVTLHPPPTPLIPTTITTPPPSLSPPHLTGPFTVMRELKQGVVGRREVLGKN